MKQTNAKACINSFFIGKVYKFFINVMNNIKKLWNLTAAGQSLIIYQNYFQQSTSFHLEDFITQLID